MKQPKTVVKLWETLCKKMKPKSPGRKMAKQYAAKAGMRSIGEIYCAANMGVDEIEYEYETVKIEYQHEPQIYTPDFILKNGKVVEFKGKMTAETRKKMISIKRSNPDLWIGIVFQKANNKLSSRPNAKRYWQWAEMNGFPWAEMRVPKSWSKGRRKTLKSK